MKSLKALLVEDSESDEKLLLRQLAKADYDVRSIRVQTATDLEKALAESDWDIVLSDYAMPGFSGLDALRILQKSGRDIPFIIISGTIGEDVAVEAMRVGVSDYLLKGNLTRLAPAIERELENSVLRRTRKQTEESLRRSEENLANAQRIVHIGSWETDLLTNRLFWSDEVYRIFDVSKDDFGATLEAFISFIHPDDRQSLQDAADAALFQNAPYNIEHRIITQSGVEKIVCEIGEVTFDETGKPVRMIGTVQDITERKRAEQLIIASEEKYRNIVETAHEGILLNDIEGRTTFVNRQMPEMLGYTADEIIGRTIFDFIFEEDYAATKEKLERRRQGEVVTGEIRLRRKDGSELICLHKSSPTRNEAGEITGFLTMNTDITEIRKAEKSIRFQANLLDVVEQAVVATDTDGIVTFWNRFAVALYGWTAAEAVGRSIIELTAPDIRKEEAAKIIGQLRAGQSWSGEFFVRTRNGETFPSYGSSSPINDDEGNVIGIVGVTTDISERIDSEKTLRESEERFRLLCEAAPLGVFLTDADGGCLFTNAYLQEVAGFSFDEALGEGYANFFHPEDREQTYREWKEATAAGKECFQQYRFLHRNGAVRWVSVRTAPIVSANSQIISHVGTVEDITARRLAEESLRQAEAQYRSLVESSPAIVYLAEPTPPYSTIYVSPNVVKFGFAAEEWFSRNDLWMSLIHPEDKDRVLRITETAMRQGLDTDIEYRIIAGDGTTRWLQDRGRFVSDEQGNRTGWQGVMLDITETKVLEEQLRQSQKLESVGRLAGGIAHDFNNMLTAINGYSELTLRKLEEDSPLRRNIEEIKKAGERSAQLTHQLLAFSRQQVLQPVVLDLNEVITDTIALLKRLIGEDVELVTSLNPKTGRVNVDPGQLSQIMMNLAVNGRDAMPQGGRLTIETSNVFLKPDDVKQKVGVLPGAYVRLAVCDTGVGIDENIQPHIFEPFFTTKEIGKGTGLGLATVYGIVKQSGGNIEVESRPGNGTTFRVYLPRVEEQATAEAEDTFVESPAGTETILLVEDEELVRNLSREFLESSGYTVIEARNGLEALEICKNGECNFDLLMTDVVMPHMGGRELAEKLTENIPDIKILFTSGYTDDAVVRHGVIETNTNFIQKPFTFEGLIRKVRELLDN